MTWTLNQIAQYKRDNTTLKQNKWAYREKRGALPAGYVHRDYSGRFTRAEALKLIRESGREVK